MGADPPLNCVDPSADGVSAPLACGHVEASKTVVYVDIGESAPTPTTGDHNRKRSSLTGRYESLGSEVSHIASLSSAFGGVPSLADESRSPTASSIDPYEALSPCASGTSRPRRKRFTSSESFGRRSRASTTESLDNWSPSNASVSTTLLSEYPLARRNSDGIFGDVCVRLSALAKVEEEPVKEAVKIPVKAPVSFHLPADLDGSPKKEELKDRDCISMGHRSTRATLESGRGSGIGDPGVPHFGRFETTESDTSEATDGQFGPEPTDAHAELELDSLRNRVSQLEAQLAMMKMAQQAVASNTSEEAVVTEEDAKHEEQHVSWWDSLWPFMLGEVGILCCRSAGDKRRLGCPDVHQDMLQTATVEVAKAISPRS